MKATAHYVETEFNEGYNYVKTGLHNRWEATKRAIGWADGNGGYTSKIAITNFKLGIAYDVVNRNTCQRRENLAKTLTDYAAEFEKMINQMNSTGNKSAKVQSILEEVVNNAETNTGNSLQEAKQQIQEADKLFQQVKNEVKDIGDTFKKISDAYANTADNFNKDRSDAITPSTTSTARSISDDKPKFAFKCSNGKFMSSENNEELMCNHNSAGQTEYFSLVQIGDKLTLKDNFGKFCWQRKGAQKMVCDRDSSDDLLGLEKFEYGDGTVAFKCRNAKYLGYNASDNSIACTAPSVRDTEKFTLGESEFLNKINL
jgi:hypothetical protein